MLQSRVMGIARVVMHTKEHLAALIPSGPALMLNTLRWATEIRPADQLKLPAAGKAEAKLKDSELKMAGQLIKDMTAKWEPDDYADKFTAAVHELISRKIKAGNTEKVEPLEEAPEGLAKSNIIDLMELLKNSLDKRKPAAKSTPAKGSAKRPAPKQSTRKRA